MTSVSSVVRKTPSIAELFQLASPETHSLLLELHSYVDGLKKSNHVAVFNTPKEPLLNGRKIDRSFFDQFNRQYNDSLRSLKGEYHNLKLNSAKKAASTMRAPAKAGSTSQLVAPFYVSDVARKFFEQANLGVANFGTYKALGDLDASSVDSRNRSEVESLHKKHFPSVPFNDKVFDDHSVHDKITQFLKMSVINSSCIKSLFDLYNAANGVVSTISKSRVVPDQFMKDHLLNMKVDWTLDGVRTLDGIDFNKYRVEAQSLFDQYEKASAEESSIAKNVRLWKTADLVPPKSKKAVSATIHQSYRLEDLNDSWAAINVTITDLKRKGSDLLIQIFGNSFEKVADPFPLLKKLLNQGKTFAEILTYNDLYNEKLGGLHNKALPVILSYLRIPSPIMRLKMSSQASAVLKDDEVVSVALGVAKKIGEAASPFKKSVEE